MWIQQNWIHLIGIVSRTGTNPYPYQTEMIDQNWLKVLIIILASRASGRRLDTQTLKNHASGHLIFF